MRAIVIDAPGTVHLQERAAKTPAPHEVTIAVELVGICATDLHIMDGHFPTAQYPLVPGHEAMGTIVAIGSGVTSLEIGSRVVIDPALPCGVCALCRDGRPNLCENRNAFGISRDGGAAEQLTVPASNCYVVADETPARTAILAEPLACVLHAFDLVRSPAGRDVLIYGAGTVGMLATQVAIHLGAHSVSVVDLNAERASHAMKVGAAASARTVGELPASPTADAGWDLVIDATGAPAAITDGLGRVARGGTYLQIGVASPESTVLLSPYSLFAREITVVGSMTTRNTFPRSLSLLNAGTIDSSPITGEPLPLSDYARAIDLARTGDTPKVVVSPLL